MPPPQALEIKFNKKHDSDYMLANVRRLPKKRDPVSRVALTLRSKPLHRCEDTMAGILHLWADCSSSQAAW